MNAREVAFASVMSALAFALSALSIPFTFGLRIHFFQLAIFLCGSVAGPLAGLVCGMLGGSYTAYMRADPSIVVGNGLLGFATGILSRRFRPALAGIIAWFAAHAPWLLLIDTMVIPIPIQVIQVLFTILTVENVVSACVADLVLTKTQLKAFILKVNR